MKKYFILAAAAITLAACSNEDNINVDPNVISLSTNINGAKTRATAADNLQDAQFASGVDIHVDVYEHDGTAPVSNGIYTTTDANGTLSGSLYYPANGSNIDIEAYYPSSVTSETTSFAVTITQTSEANYQACDLMYATKLTDKAKGSTHGLTFNHALSKIIVNISNGNGVTESDITARVSAVKINNTLPTATIAKGVVSAATGSAADITITGTTVTSNIGIIVPQTIASGTTFITVTYNGSEYTYALADETVFEAGKVYTYALTLSSAGITLSSTTIASWTNGGTTTPDAIIL